MQLISNTLTLRNVLNNFYVFRSTGNAKFGKMITESLKGVLIILVNLANVISAMYLVNLVLIIISSV